MYLPRAYVHERSNVSAAHCVVLDKGRVFIRRDSLDIQHSPICKCLHSTPMKQELACSCIRVCAHGSERGFNPAPRILLTCMVDAASLRNISCEIDTSCSSLSGTEQPRPHRFASLGRFMAAALSRLHPSRLLKA
eukprot:5513147-Pleurochrysis_carterae.AAC.1